MAHGIIMFVFILNTSNTYKYCETAIPSNAMKT